ncbi:hypothetical protein BDR06DRAFT_976391 [Suillus hirtellus]|nr:hypothetical protein BDR06DRAFT_976391 [Suillus hirtellus]
MTPMSGKRELMKFHHCQYHACRSPGRSGPLAFICIPDRNPGSVQGPSRTHDRTLSPVRKGSGSNRGLELDAASLLYYYGAPKYCGMSSLTESCGNQSAMISLATNQTTRLVVQLLRRPLFVGFVLKLWAFPLWEVENAHLREAMEAEIEELRAKLHAALAGRTAKI